MELFLAVVGCGASLLLILLAWRKVQWESEDLRYMLMKEFVEEKMRV